MYRRGFTLIELLVVIAIIAILAAILFPVFARAREKARQASCGSNLKQISLGMLMYIQDYDEMFPYYAYGSYTVDPWIFWPHQLQPYIKNWQLYRCPSNASAPGTYHAAVYPEQPKYGFAVPLWGTPGGLALAVVQRPSEKYMCFDSNHQALGDVRAILTASACGQWTCNANVNTTHLWLVPHNEGVNIGFVDGHVKWQQGNAVWGNYAWCLDPTAP